jgi:hypothetical protein
MAGLEGWVARSASLPLVEGLFAVCRAFSVLSMQAIARAKAASRPRSARCAQPPVAVPGGWPGPLEWWSLSGDESRAEALGRGRVRLVPFQHMVTRWIGR